MPWKHVKEKTPIIGIDDSPFDFEKDERTFIFGVVMKGSRVIEDVLSYPIGVDATPAKLTEDIAAMLNQSTQKGQLRAILLNGITFGGFGIVDLEELYTQTSIPTISLVDHKPDLARIKEVLLGHFEDGAMRWQVVEKNGPPTAMMLNGKQVFIQYYGLSQKTTEFLIKKTTKVGFTKPEALRIAHMIGASVGRIYQ